MKMRKWRNLEIHNLTWHTKSTGPNQMTSSSMASIVHRNALAFLEGPDGPEIPTPNNVPETTETYRTYLSHIPIAHTYLPLM
jgi:hypothetical protein